jgi:hypothetical protein
VIRLARAATRFSWRELQQRHACLEHGPEAQLYRKGRGKEAKLSLMGHALMENRSGLTVAATLTKATGTAERDAAETMTVRHWPGAHRISLRADKGYDAAAFAADMRALNVTPRIAQNLGGRRSAIDACTTRHPGYTVGQQKRKRIGEPFGWGKASGGLARPMLRGVRKLGFNSLSQWPDTISSACQSSSRPQHDPSGEHQALP